VHGHAVRENTLLSFQKAAVNHSDYIEFDVSWWGGGGHAVWWQATVWRSAGAEGCGGQPWRDSDCIEANLAPAGGLPTRLPAAPAPVPVPAAS